MFRLTPTNVSWCVAYAIMVLTVVRGMTSYRASALQHYASASATEHWREWREAASDVGRVGSVDRQAPQSAEPPALVLMRDHFAACLGVALLLSSCLFVWFMVCARGAMRPVELNLDRDE